MLMMESRLNILKGATVFICLLFLFSCQRNVTGSIKKEDKDIVDALDTVRKRREQYGFEYGTGLRESIFLEKLGRLEDSICAAFQELEYQYSMNNLTREALMEGMELMKSQVIDPESAKITLGLEAYILGEFNKAAELLSCNEVEEESEARCYYRLASVLRSGNYGERDLHSYGSLEPLFRNFGPYYTNLWKTLKAGKGLYNGKTVGAVIVKSMVLTQEPEQKAEAARELARLYEE